MSLKAFTTGCDPEMFARRIDNGAITSVAGLLGCTKEKKRVLSPNIRLQEDNVLAEFDIDPCQSFESFNESVLSGILLTKNLLAEHGMDIAEGVSSHIYTQDELRSFDKSAFVFGCTPDYNAMTGMSNPSPKSENPGLRTAGGHIHIGFPSDVTVDRDRQMDAGLLCDYFLSLPSLFIDTDVRRKELYGKAGAIRFKPYGVEYRSLSNFWIFKEELRKMIYEQVEKVVNELVTDKIMELNSVLPIEQLHQIINTNDLRQAESYMARFNIV